MKHIFSVFLAVCLLAGLMVVGAVPALAAVNWDDFYIITQSTEALTVPFGTAFTLSVEVNIPAGAEVTYQWGQVIRGRPYSYKMEDATEPVFKCSAGDYGYPNAPSGAPYAEQSKEYACTITAVEKDGSGNVVDSAVFVTQGVTVTVLAEREATRWEAFRDRWLTGPLFATVAVCAATYGIAIPVAPIIWLYFLITYPGLA